MLKRFKFLFLVLVLALVLVACSSDDEGEAANDPEEESTQTEEEQETESTEESDASVELGMGETAELKTTLGNFNLTLLDAEEQAEIDGEQPQLDTFVVTEWEVENTSEEPLQVADAVSALDMYSGKDDTGRGWILLENQDPWEKELQPGEKASGELLFELYQTEEYYAGMEYASAESSLKSVMWKFSLE
ncbi:hypothetical protein [Thalassobacillus hwangdonensis]|uniref:DUF4352 domain-containing protein n=1 Tax=Thalassobacillus hwangdonensis TaxID=546108 RepID=A0ABW3L3W5_9BACI